MDFVISERLVSGNGVLDNLVQIKISDSQLVIMKLHKLNFGERSKERSQGLNSKELISTTSDY